MSRKNLLISHHAIRSTMFFGSLLSLCIGTAYGQIAELDLPQMLVDENGVSIPSGRLNIKDDLLKFGDGVGPVVDFEARYPLVPNNYNDCCDIKMLVYSATNPINRHYNSPACCLEIQTEMTPSGMAAYVRVSSAEISTGDGKYFKKPAGGVFNVPVFNGPYVPGQTRTQLGVVDRMGNNYSPLPGIGRKYTKSDGEQWRIFQQTSSFPNSTRIRNISTSRGFFIQYEYEREALPTTQAQVLSWLTVKRISLASLAHVYCDPSSSSICQAAINEGNYASIDYTDGATITHTDGSVKKYKLTSTGSLEISSPGTNRFLTATSTSWNDCNDKTISQISSSGSTWTYDYTCTVGEQTNDWNLKRTSPLGGKLSAFGTTRDSVPELYQDELLRLHSFDADPLQGYTGFGFPEGGKQYLIRDTRNNIIEAGRYAKDNATKLVSYTASYAATCSNFLVCNQPIWTRDGNGNQTDYVYDPNHGGVLTETGPADANGVRPQKRYEYAQRYAWLKNSTGGYAQAATPIWVRTKEEHCVSTSAISGGCAGGAADEVVTTYDYGPNAGPNNLLVRGVAVAANGETLRTCYGYDRMGRRISETKAAANIASCP